MLRLSGITKDYKVADTKVRALKDINLAFRKNEFVSVLGPSGCGKTTLLNLVGGLDKYTYGDLFIGGKSTSEFKDRDWDVYRNHRVGFIFQSYNLIPHQSVLGNVELALTIAGMSKAERVAKAKQALDLVGLSDQYYKKPNQLSGGQSQRVAIARALVNDPEILLADEPTGALDTVTSVQIMELIKTISEDRLVIMVTHNPELAYKYSTRIIKLLDGELQDDSNPFSVEDEIEEVKQLNEKAEQLQAEEGAQPSAKKEKAKMSFLTAFKLSLHNLISKKSRTILTSFAGSIGIIGVSLVLSMSFGIQGFINNMQNDMLSGFPVVITKTAYDISELMSNSSTTDKAQAVKEATTDGYINVNSVIESLVKRSENINNIMISNTITDEYVKFVSDMPTEYATIFLDYGIDIMNNLFTDFKENETKPAQSISLAAIRSVYASVLDKTEYKEFGTYISAVSDVFGQTLPDDEYVMSQYEQVSGRLPQAKNEIMIVLDGGSELADLTLAQLGYYTQDEFFDLVVKATDETSQLQTKTMFSYDELLGRKFTWYPNDVLFEVAPPNPLSMEVFNYKAYYDNSFSGGVELEVVGILKPNEDISFGCLSSGFYYTKELTEYIIEENYNSEIARYCRDNDQESFQSGEIDYLGTKMSMGITYKYNYSYLGVDYTDQIGYLGRTSMMSALMSSIPGLGDMFGNSDTYALSLQQLGGINLPETIAIYAKDFKQKNFALAYLDKWNSDEDLVVGGVVLTADMREEITYTDELSLIISIVNNLINIVTTALIGFTSLSLVVSCVMIAIITYVSVVERIKEIGVIRSLGGRKIDVSYLFNAETFIIGLASGLIGIIVTYLLSAIINIIVKALIGVAIASFPWYIAIIMVSVSIVLTLISGLLPSRAAAQKDPVVALRTE